MTTTNDWQLGPFQRLPEALLGPDADLKFRCPVRGEIVRWAAKDVFNPGAVVRGDEICLLIRAEDNEGTFAGTSRIGLATSRDGEHFQIHPEPVIFPDRDRWQAWEWEGGCEDPRVVEHPDGGFICLYSAFDGKHCGLFAASSPDLLAWEKHGPAFGGTSHAKRWGKSGSVVTEVRDGRLVAARINGKFRMYWGEGVCFAATSDDLIRWQPLEFDGAPDRFVTYGPNTGSGSWGTQTLPGANALRPLLFPRPGRYDSRLVEPGPPAVLTPDGIVLIYNGSNHATGGDPQLPPDCYAPGQVLFDAHEPASCVARATEPMLRPEGRGETLGQYHNVCFAQGLVCFRGQWRLYFGMADSRIGGAVAPLSPGLAMTA